MLVDTHCHINMMVKKSFDIPLSQEDMLQAQKIVTDAAAYDVTRIINVGTSVQESFNCIELAQKFTDVFAVVGIHPNDCTDLWREDMHTIKKMLEDKEQNKIVGIGECGLDFHYPEYDKVRQIDAFKVQIELALEHDLALVIHSRDAGDETLFVLDEYKKELKRGVFHCYSYDAAFAQDVIDFGFVLGIGGTITYPKNDTLRSIVQSISLNDFVLETDAPFLPPQIIRGKQNSPIYIKTIAEYISQLRSEPLDTIAQHTTQNALRLFNI